MRCAIGASSSCWRAAGVWCSPRVAFILQTLAVPVGWARLYREKAQHGERQEHERVRNADSERCTAPACANGWSVLLCTAATDNNVLCCQFWQSPHNLCATLFKHTAITPRLNRDDRSELTSGARTRSANLFISLNANQLVTRQWQSSNVRLLW